MGLDICHVKPSIRTKDTLEYFTLLELQSNPDFLYRHKHLITKNDSGEHVIFYREVGYQRKQVSPEFIHVFENDRLYFQLSDVQKVKHYLLADNKEEQQTLEADFQKHFIDSFVEGESVFFISY